MVAQEIQLNPLDCFSSSEGRARAEDLTDISLGKPPSNITC